MIDKFVVGFAFNMNASFVLLIRKLHPSWQKGHLNGIGGKVEEGETTPEAMCRECEEETGLSLTWQRRGMIQGIHSDEEGYTAHDGNAFQCCIFYAYSHDIFEFKQTEDEVLGIYRPDRLNEERIVEDLRFLIPFGMYSKLDNAFMSLNYTRS